jgi:hypothetical protein
VIRELEERGKNWNEIKELARNRKKKPSPEERGLWRGWFRTSDI